MSDIDLRGLRRAAEAKNDAATWLALARSHLRAGDRDAAAEAATVAGGAHDTSDLLDQLTPALDDFVAERRELDVAPTSGLRWTPEGKGVYGLLDQSAALARVELQIAEVDLDGGRVRTIVRSSPKRQLYHLRAHPVIDSAGKYVAFGASDPHGAWTIATAERATGSILAQVTRCREELHALTVSGSSLLTCREAFLTRFFQLTSEGLPRRARALRALRGVSAITSPDGVRYARPVSLDRVGLFEAPEDVPRAVVPAADPEHVLPVGRRVVIVGRSRVRLYGPTGELLGGARRPTGSRQLRAQGVPAPSPSGWLVAFCFRASPTTGGEPRVELVDLRTG